MKLEKSFLLIGMLASLSLAGCDSTPEADVSHVVSQAVEISDQVEISTPTAVMTENIEPTTQNIQAAAVSDMREVSSTNPPQEIYVGEQTTEAMEEHGKEFYAETLKKIEAEKNLEENR